MLVLKIYKKKYCTNGLSKVCGKQSSMKYQSAHLQPGNYILNRQKGPLKQAGGGMFHLTNL